MLRLPDLDTIGWTCVSGISSRAGLLELGRALGTPVPTPNGEIIKEIRVTSASKATPGTQSSIHGTGPFPLHTDTVFWPVPVRYVILRAYGDTRRPTTVITFDRLLRECGTQFSSLAKQSVWLVGKTSEKLKKFYCSLKFRHGLSDGWRYDGDCMSPANPAAAKANRILQHLVAAGNAHPITWSNDTAVVLSNWKVLHGRGPEPDHEGILCCAWFSRCETNTSLS
jgi:hypothetical protein